jgi:uncharacterized membrane protein YqjE
MATGLVRGLLGHATGLAHARLALFGSELREEVVRSGLLLLGACAALALGLLALAAGAAGVMFAVSAEQRPSAALAFGLGFAICAGWLAWRVRRALAARPAAFAASLAELEKDREALVARSDTARAGLGEASGELVRLVSIGVLAYSIARRLTSKG